MCKSVHGCHHPTKAAKLVKVEAALLRPPHCSLIGTVQRGHGREKKGSKEITWHMVMDVQQGTGDTSTSQAGQCKAMTEGGRWATVKSARCVKVL